MKKRIMSLILCFVLVLGMFPGTAHADYEDGAECANCGHWHYDDYMCECGLCSSECSHYECWYETHCKNCGGCYMSADNWCDECGWCQDCMDNEAHCTDCGRCFVGEDKSELCEECLRCSDCVENGVCDYCNKCDSCADTDHCVECHAHVLSGCCVKCGKCYECADGFVCDTCGHCESCAAEEDLHCEFYGGCLEDIDPCPAHEFDSHCKYCVDYCESCGECSYDGDIDGLCADCGLCYECCAERSMEEGCSMGDVCVESSEWDEHLCPGSCGECFCDKERCDDCGYCEECCAENSMDEGCSTGEVCKESSEWDEHFCPDCGGCFCEYEQCSDCGLCADCCAVNAFEEGCDCGDVCVKSTEWEDHMKNYHGEDGAVATHTHKYKSEWNADKSHHWHECRFCDDKSGEEAHKLTAAGQCETCGYDTSSLLFFVSQPQDLTRKVSAANPYGDDDPNAPINNRAVFSVTAVDLAGNGLSYQWYEVRTDKTGKETTTKLDDAADDTIGSTDRRLSVPVWSGGCIYSYSYYCVVTSTDAEGNEVSIESRHAQLRTVHNYGAMEPVENIATTPGSGTPYRITYTDAVSGAEVIDKIYYRGNLYHNSWCVGDGCKRTQYPEETEHSMRFEGYLGEGYLSTDQEKKPLYFYRWVCTECGYEDLDWYAERKTDIPYSIFFKDTPGAYMMDEDDNEGILSAMAGAELWAHAPYVNKSGYIFDHWEVVSGPAGFTNDSIENNYDTGRFFMPKGSITLCGVYSTDKKPVYEVQIKGVSHEIKNGVITVRAGDSFTVTADILPETAAYKQAYWFAETDPTDLKDPVIQFSKKDSNNTSGTWSKDIEGAVTLTARKPGTVLLRALSAESRDTTSNAPIQDSVIIKVIPAETTPQTHNYKETTVFATCIKKGYTLHECTDEGCTEKYLSDLKNPTGHTDSDGDGLCDNVDQNTGKVCGYKMGGENTSMVGLTKIKKVELTIAAPVRGKSPATTATPTGDEKDCYGVANITWDPDTKTFVGGTKYSVLIELEAKDQYGFKLDGIEVANTQFYINGNKATVVSKGAQEVSISYEFPATGIGSTGSTAYTVTVLGSKNGDVTSSRKTASAGSTVTLTVSPDKGYTLETLSVLDRNGKEIQLTEKNGKYTFIMPASNVEVEATFMDDNTMLNFFVDIKASDYFYDAVLWAAEQGITGGTDAAHFTPNGVCTRAQAVTFLWRAAGSPAPKSTTMPFTDVAAGSYYEQAVLWAVENGITKGTSDTTFSPNLTCSRAQIVTFLWRSQKSPAAGSVNPFTDVKSDAYYADAVLWAVKESVTSGTTATTFSPNADCTRAQIVTFIYRALAE